MTEAARPKLTRNVAFSPPMITDEDVDAVVSVLRSGWLTTGAECRRLESELADFLGAPHVVAVSSCTAALEISLAWLQLPPGSFVAVPDWTFVATALAAMRTGARVLLVDVDENTLNISTEALARALHDHSVKVVIPVHMGGIPVDPELWTLCDAQSVAVVEDAAHAFGSQDNRGPVNGCRSTSACFSFYATKNLTCAEGGAIATFDAAFADFARSFRLHGLGLDAWSRYGTTSRRPVELSQGGIKANLPDVLGALARSQLRRFGTMQATRQQLVSRYRRRLAGIDGIRPVPVVADPGSANHLLMVALDPGIDRTFVRDRLDDAGVTTSIHFPPLHRHAWLASRALVGPGGLPTAERMADRVLSLPLSAKLNEVDVDYVCDVLADALDPG